MGNTVGKPADLDDTSEFGSSFLCRKIRPLTVDTGPKRFSKSGEASDGMVRILHH